MARKNPLSSPRLTGFLATFLPCILGASVTQAQWVLEQDVMGAGGGTSSSGDYQVSDASGQLGIESREGLSYQLAEGFWNALAAAGTRSSPIAQADTVLRAPIGPAKFSVYALLANDTEDSGHRLQLVSVSPLSAFGGSVRLAWPWVYYSPPTGPDAPDSFTYTASDSFGGSATAAVSILIASPSQPPAQNIVGIETPPNGHRLIRFAGVPGLIYHIEASSDLISWIRVGEAEASALGEFLWDDADAILFSERFYRSTWP